MLINLKDFSTSYGNRKMLAILLWSFACGVPLLLLLSTLSARLLQNDLPLETISFFSLATLPYCLKFLLSPIIERVKPPILYRYLGRVRGWMVISMCATILSLISIGLIHPNTHHNVCLLFIAVFITCTFAAATDTAEAALRIELLDKHSLGPGAAIYAVGYHIGMVSASAITLILADIYNWRIAYGFAASLIIIGIIAVICQKQAPTASRQTVETKGYQQLLNHWQLSSNWLKASIKKLYGPLIAPTHQFIQNKAWLLIILTIIFYLYSDDTLAMMSNPFYLTIGFSKSAIGMLNGSVGLVLLIVGGIGGGLLIKKFNTLPILLIAALLHMLTTLSMALLASEPHNPIANHNLFVFSICFGQLISGMINAGYAALLAQYSKKPYTASHNAIFTSLMAIARVIFAEQSGYFAQSMAWTGFFCFTTLIMLPSVILLIALIRISARQL